MLNLGINNFTILARCHYFCFDIKKLLMKKAFASLFFLLFLSQISWSQSGPIRQQSFGISYIRNDFNTAQSIRSSSLSATIRNKKLLKFSDMTSGVGLHYFKGVAPHIDFASTLNIGSTKEGLPGKTLSENRALLELDASINLKMLDDSYKFTPYIIAGIGGSKYGSYYGAFIPLGGGLRFKFKSNAVIFSTLQYRVPVTEETAGYHIVASLGGAWVFGKKKA
jgi:OmpA-OmpF porin, OOP family